MGARQRRHPFEVVAVKAPWLLVALVLLLGPELTAACTVGECLRHSDCPRDWRCRRSLCVFAGTFRTDASVSDTSDAQAGANTQAAGAGGSGGMNQAGSGAEPSMAMAGGGAGGLPSEPVDASVSNNVGLSTDAGLDASIVP